MKRSTYLTDVHHGHGGTAFVVLEAGPGHEVRGQRTADGIRVEIWTRAETVDLSAESISRLHALADARLPTENGSK